MKTFYIIILVFCVTVGGILFNRARVNNFTEEIVERLTALNPWQSAAEEISELEADISKELKLLEFSIPKRQINSLRNYASLLVIQHKLGETADFEATRLLLISELREIYDAERISFSNIF